MKIVSLLVFSLLLIHSYPLNAQPYAPIEDIHFNTSKNFVEDFVVERIKAYYIHNTDNSWKTIRKKQGINLSKQSARDIFLKNLESDIRTQFQQVDELEKVDLYTKYQIIITEVIGRYAQVLGFAPYKGLCGEGNYNIGFLDDKIRFITFNIRTTTSFSKFSGHEYFNEYVQKLKSSLSNIDPGFKHSSYKSSTNVCSDRGEPQYNEVFTLNKSDNYKFSITNSFGPLVRQNNNYSCTYLGNHLTSINVFIWNDKLK